MIKKIPLAIVVALAGTSLYAADAPKDKTHMFPTAKEGFVQHVIEVPKTENDDDHRVELLIGKTMLVDCNKHSLRGNVETVNLKGWGYNYLEVSKIQRGPTTMMACPEPKVEKFISLYDPKIMMRRYNSRLGTVIYVPKGYEVRYRVWSAGADIKEALQR